MQPLDAFRCDPGCRRWPVAGQLLATGLLLGFGLMLATASVADTYLVDDPADVCPGSTPGTLRWAVEQATLHAGPDTVTFDLAGMVIDLSCDLPPIEGTRVGANGDGTVILGDSAAGPCGGVPKVTLRSTVGITYALHILSADDCVVRGLRLEGFALGIVVEDGLRTRIGDTAACELMQIVDGGTGVTIAGADGGDNVVQNNQISLQDAWGIDVTSGSQRDTVGGFGSNERNYVYSCAAGIRVVQGAHDAWIANNHVGLDPSGSAYGNSNDGIEITQGRDNRIEGNTVVLSGGHGVVVYGLDAITNVIVDNQIGTDESGAPGLGNLMKGILVWGSAVATSISGNVVASSGHHGISVIDPGTTAEISGNWIGTNESSALGLGNSLNGVYVGNQAGATIIRDNVIGASHQSGIALMGDAVASTIIGNLIGTDGDFSNNLLGNTEDGILVRTSTNVIGGSAPGEANVIACNGGFGVRLIGPGTVSGNKIQSNTIGGVDLATGNLLGGISVGAGVTDNDIGGSDLSEGNLIKYNGDYGVRIGASGGNIPIMDRMLYNLIFRNVNRPIDLWGGGNDEIAAPTIDVANATTGTVMGATNLPTTTYETQIQVTYDSPTEGCGFVGETTTTDAAWSVSGYFPHDALLCATNTSTWPRLVPPTQTSECPEELVHATWWEIASFPLGLNERAMWTSAVDFDVDGLQDVWISNRQGPNRLYRNLGDGMFEPVVLGALAAPGLPNASAAWADVDNDGRPDVYLVHDGAANQLFRNESPLGFTDVTPAVLADPGMATSAAWLDIDTDGNLDLVMVDASGFLLEFHNEEGFVFTAGDPLGGQEGEDIVPVPADYDQDGDPDLYVVRRQGANSLLRNDAAAGFVDVTTPELGDPGIGRAATWADLDQDGLLDLYIVNDQGPNRLVWNLGGGVFEISSDPAVQDPGNGRAVAVGDVENDGDLDLYVVNHQQPNRLLLYDGGRSYTLDHGQSALEDPRSGRGAVMVDLDLDGDQELFLINGAMGEPNVLFTNGQNTTNHWLSVRLTGTQSNRQGIGALVVYPWVYDPDIQIVREVGSGASPSQNPATLALGLGNFVTHPGGEGPDTAVAMVETLLVYWPSGVVQMVNDIEADQLVTIEEPVSSAIASGTVATLATRLVSSEPNPFNPSVRIRFELAQPGVASLRIFDVSGRLVRILLDGDQMPGAHAIDWDGRDQERRRVSSGVYYVTLESGGHQETQKLTMLK